MGDKLRSQSWVFDLFIVSRTPSIEKFKAYMLAEVHNFSEFLDKNPFRTLLAVYKMFQS